MVYVRFSGVDRLWQKWMMELIVHQFYYPILPSARPWRTVHHTWSVWLEEPHEETSSLFPGHYDTGSTTVSPQVRTFS
jgi:hypothetical protein